MAKAAQGRSSPMADELIPCQYCGGKAALGRDHLAAWCYCTRCLARGPSIAMSRADCDAQAEAAWNQGKKFGRLAVATVPSGMPAATCSIAERLRLAIESLYLGELGSPDCAILILRDGKRAHTITHRISDADAVRVLEAVRDAARARVSVVLPQPSTR